MIPISPGCRVCLRYEIRLDDGTVADGNLTQEPLWFTMGDGTLIRGLELALYGLMPGDKQTIRIEPGDAFGFADPQNRHWIERERFPDHMDVSPGQVLELAVGEHTAAGTVVAVEQERVLLDMNHPLAGHEIEFYVEILEVKPEDGEQPPA